jgi:hypothetical protein
LLGQRGVFAGNGIWPHVAERIFVDEVAEDPQVGVANLGDTSEKDHLVLAGRRQDSPSNRSSSP